MFPGPTLELAAGSASVVVEAGASRVASLVVGGHDLLVPRGNEHLLWGCYPMVPWAGRLGLGRFTFAEETIQVPVDLPPHAIHGLGTRRAWTPSGDGFELDLSDLWPLGGVASTSFELGPDQLTMVVGVRATTMALPAAVGWHPCFRRRLASSTAAPVELHFAAGHWWPRGADGLPTGRRSPVPGGPWDDCFGGVTDPPVLSWIDGPTLTLDSPTETWVVFDERDHAMCVEPQSGPPDAFNMGNAEVLGPGETTRLALTIRWNRPD